jgi:NADPH2:quinone reductase
MKAAWYEKNGPAAEVLEVGEMPADEPGAEEVRVRLHASGVNPSDVKNRAGTTRKLAFPRQIPDSDGAGTVDTVGAGVTGFAAGDRVWVYNGAFGRPHGTAAEFVTLPAAQVAALPAGLDFAQGACLGIPAMTAHRCLCHYAVQLAKWGGAKVIATVSSPEKAEHARAGGADHVLDYRNDPLAERVGEITGGTGVERIVEVELGNLEQDLALIRNDGVIAFYGAARREIMLPPFTGLIARNPVLRMVLVYTMPDAAKAQAVADIARWCGEAGPQFAIAGRFPLEEVAAAHQYVEAGRKIGHVVLDIA